MKIICVGQNYQSHNLEMGRKADGDTFAPVLFMKPDTAILSTDKKHFYIPDFTTDVHYEAEIVIKISKVGKNIAERFAHRYYDELTLGLDMTARDLQADLKQKGLPWEIAKAFDNSAILGDFIPKESFDLNSLKFDLLLNGVKVQEGNTADMIHSIDSLIAHISQYFTLKTGDLIFTGTPAGVGKVNIGDHLEGSVESNKLLDVKIC